MQFNKLVSYSSFDSLLILGHFDLVSIEVCKCVLFFISNWTDTTCVSVKIEY
uniref:Uncharacterized protein n=1 Tax=Anguilla anguilla TaxID=7936 RepID=A0A0E9QLQ3_ANGAN